MIGLDYQVEIIIVQVTRVGRLMKKRFHSTSTGALIIKYCIQMTFTGNLILVSIVIILITVVLPEEAYCCRVP